MTDWFEFGAWVVGLLLLHEGLASRWKTRRRGPIQVVAFVGAAILLIGTGLWYWNAQASQQLADILQAPPVTTKVATQTEEFEKLPLPQRKDFSTRLAKAAFVSGGELADVVNDGGHWTPYSPSAEDIKARDRQVKMISEVNFHRQELIAKAQLSEKHWRRWLMSLIVAVCTGLLTGRLRARFTGS